MPKLDFLDLNAKLAGYANIVRANRSACDTRFARVVHDRLADALKSLAGACRKGVEAEGLLLTEAV